MGVVFTLVLTLGGWIGLTAFRVYDRLTSEDAIVHGGMEIANAIDKFTEAQGHPPVVLDDLVPATLPAIPTLDHVDQVVYRYSESDQTWSLRLHSNYADEPRVYLLDSEGALEPQDEARMIGSIHGWAVLSDRPGVPSDK